MGCDPGIGHVQETRETGVSMNQLTEWATAQFVAVGGADWKGQLAFGGAIALVVICLITVVLTIVIWGNRS